MAKTAGRKPSAPRATMTAEEARDHLRVHFKLIAKIMSARRDADTPHEQHFLTYERMLHHDYPEFARTKAFPREADAKSRLEDVFEHMRQIRLAPRLASRNICAVAGGFSSGKSSLLNRLMGTDLLPTKLTPTTSIPTYVSHHADDVTIKAFNRHGGSMDIQPDELRQMTHGFGTIDGGSDGIPLQPIVDRISILTPSLQQWSNVAFVDTPGHTNSGRNDGASQDEQVAEREALASRFLLAVVDCERGGLSHQDIDFISRFAQKLPAESHDQPGPGRLRQDSASIYVVLNKADKKEADRRSILKSVAETVERRELPCFGVGLYSAHAGEWFDHVNGTFDEFLQMIDGNPIKMSLDAVVESVFNDYAKFHDDERTRFRELDGLLKRLQLERDNDEGLAAGRTLGSDLKRHLERVEKEIGRHAKAVQDSRSLKDSFVHCTRSFVESAGLAVAPSEDQEQRRTALQRKVKGVPTAYQAAMRRRRARPRFMSAVKSPEAPPRSREPQRETHDFGDGMGAVPAHRHFRGGGWVSETATVMDNAHVGRNAQVFGRAQVFGNARVEDRACVGGDAIIYGNALLDGRVSVFDNSRVYDNAKIREDVEISGNASVYDSARILGSARVGDDAEVFGDARVEGSAKIRGTTRVGGDARVFGNAQVLNNAQVLGDAEISGKAVISENARIYGSASVSGEARIYGNAEISDSASVSERAQVCGDAKVYGNSTVGEDARVCGDARVKRFKNVQGSTEIGTN